MDPATVKHPGIVEKIENGTIYIRVTQHSACASCHSKGACSAMDVKDKIVEVPVNNTKYAVGEKVQVSMQLSMGNKAVVFSYLLPFLFFMIGVISVYTATDSDGLAGITGVSVLLVYYVVLFLNRKKFSKQVVFVVSKFSE